MMYDDFVMSLWAATMDAVKEEEKKQAHDAWLLRERTTWEVIPVIANFLVKLFGGDSYKFERIMFNSNIARFYDDEGEGETATFTVEFTDEVNVRVEFAHLMEQLEKVGTDSGWELQSFSMDFALRYDSRVGRFHIDTDNEQFIRKKIADGVVAMHAQNLQTLDKMRCTYAHRLLEKRGVIEGDAIHWRDGDAMLMGFVSIIDCDAVLRSLSGKKLVEFSSVKEFNVYREVEQ